MAKCKYPNEVCKNMTMLNSVPYCDSVPCSLKDELPKQTNADKIRAMSDEELAEFLSDNTNCDCCNIQCPDKLNCPSMSSCYCRHKEWLKKEVEDE